MRFTKMQGLGNDYIYVNCLEEQVEDPSRVARELSDRHFGIGSDGLILIRPSVKADFFMEMFNADGSRSEMCGNGIRCVGKYVYDHGLIGKTEITVNTLAGVKRLGLHVVGGLVDSVTVDMGAPELAPSRVPVALDGDRAVAVSVEVGGRGFEMTCVSMGNPHAVMFVDDTTGFPLERFGPLFEGHELFPQRVNAEFVEVLGRDEVKMRVWERGTGETLACGTGACASVVACVLNGLTGEEATVHLLGGDLRVRWDQEGGHAFMTGPAVEVFSGEVAVAEAAGGTGGHVVDPEW